MTPYAKPRFITDPEIIRKILDRCKIIHLGMQKMAMYMLYLPTMVIPMRMES